ncbi:MAG: transglutaminase family protein [Chitinophagaceae bacterium]|nr:transglutaminase family protein [Chitinophagaceae bacterium]
MKHNKEIKALFHLLDDPDRVVFDTIADRIVHYGKEIIPNLESLWEHTADTNVQERIENIIHKVNFNDVYLKMQSWFETKSPSLLTGAIELARYQYPDLDEDSIRKTYKSIYQSCWLELNKYLTPLEQINIINSIFYSMYKFKGAEIDEHKPNHSYINEVMESRIGTNYTLGILYQSLCEMLDIPVYCIQLPRQFMLAYFDTPQDAIHKQAKPVTKILFYMDPGSGTIYSQNDVDVYLRKYELQTHSKSFLPLDPKDVIWCLIESLAQVYDALGEEVKVNELSLIMQLFR